MIGCGAPFFANDMFCDDNNNNEECNWDGGACCLQSFFFPNWNKFCKACDCLDPDAGIDCLCYHSGRSKADRSFTLRPITNFEVEFGNIF